MFHMNEIYTVRKKLNLNFFSHDAKLLVHEQSNPTENDILNNFITKLKANNNWAGKQYVGMKRSELLLQSGVYRRVHPALYIRILSRFLHLHARPPSNSLSCFFSPRVSEEREETLFSSLPSSLHKVSRGVATRAWAVGRLHFLADHYFSLTPTRACGQHARTQTHTSPDGCTCTPGGLRIFSLFAPATTLPFPSSRELGVSRCILMKKFVTSLRHPAAAATAAEAAPAKKERVGKRNERFLIVVGSLLFPLAAASISLRLFAPFGVRPAPL